MTVARERLYNLLPAVYRVRDRAAGDQLRALVGLIERELDVVEADIERLYDDWFIETCQEWVVPYIGDLLGVSGVLPIEGAPFSQRGLIANTIAYRRAKGTVAVLEQLARDVTGWDAKAVEYFDLLATTRAMNHRRRNDVSTVHLRDADGASQVGRPFERAAHLADVRHVDNGRGRYNIPNVGVNLWRLQSYPLDLAVRDGVVLVAATAREVEGTTAAERGRYTFSPLGHDLPLFNVPRAEEQLTQLASEPNVRAPLRRRPLHDELEARRQAVVDGRSDVSSVYFDDSRPVFRVAVANPGVARRIVPPEEVLICDLSDPDESPATGWRRPPASKTYRRGRDGTQVARPISVGVDPVLGRLAFPAGTTYETVEVSYAYGFPGDLGGGPYDRRASIAGELPVAVDWQRGVSDAADSTDADVVRTLKDAVEDWNLLSPRPAVGLIVVLDSRTYEDDLTIDVPAGSRLLVAAGDWPVDAVPASEVGLAASRRSRGRVLPRDRRPHVQGKVEVRGSSAPGKENPGELVIDGLLLEGGITVQPGDLGRLRVAHSTIVPGAAGLTVTPAVNGANRSLEVELERAICGPVSLAEAKRLRVVDSIVDADGAEAIVAREADADVRASTVVGTTAVRTLGASNSIFGGRATVTHRQDGCVRYCYVPLDSVVGRRYRCHPVDEAAAVRVAPVFTSLDYRGAPSAYGQLGPGCAHDISTGADDEGELGAFNFLKNAHRLANLTNRLDEYLRFGLEAGVFFET